VALWMVAQLAPETQDAVRRRLALRLDPPVSEFERRRRDLAFAGALLDSVVWRPGWSFPYVSRSEYDKHRPSSSPSSAALVARYGSWVAVCCHAHRLAAGASRVAFLGVIADKGGAARAAVRRYSRQHAIAALNECADELERAPSRDAYGYWRATAKRRRRGTHRYPSVIAIGRLYAERGGWRAALEDAGLVEPPAMTVRVVVATKAEARDLMAIARRTGFMAAHAGNRNWLEVRGTLEQGKRFILGCARTRTTNTVTLWEPQTRTLARIQLDTRPGGTSESAIPL
jgi:hypothetical protein